MSNRYFQIRSGKSKSVGFCGTYVDHDWYYNRIKMLDGPSKGSIIRVGKENMREITKAEYDKYVSERDKNKVDTSKTFGVLLNGSLWCLPDLTEEQASEKVKEVKLIDPERKVLLIKVIGEAQAPTTTVVIK